MSADIARNLRSLVSSCVNSYCTLFIFPVLIFFKICCFLDWIQSVNPDFFLTIYYNGSPYICDGSVGYSAGGYSLSPRCFLTWHSHPVSELAAPMSADIARNLRSQVCSCLNSYCTLLFFPLLIFFKICYFLHWVQSVQPHFFVTLYYKGSPYICDT